MASERLINFRSVGKKIMAVGRNYKALAAEQGNPIPEKPIVFMKPTTSYITQGQSIKIPPECKCMYFEVELGLVISKRCSLVSEADVDQYIGGYVLVLDMTAQDLHREAKGKGHPWCLPKGFDTACPVSDFIPKEKVKDYSDIELWLKVDGVSKQRSSTNDMIFSIPRVVSYISSYVTLEEGDVVITGSPAGAGPVTAGEVIEAGLADIVSMTFPVSDNW